jgi:DNA repair exonuclease SbcCD nuclease subunit
MFCCITIGDVHCTVDSISDCENLFEFVRIKTKDRDCKNLLFLGDLFHTHNIIQSEVLSFYKKQIDLLLTEGYSVFILLGNHDKSAAGLDLGPHALEVFKGYGQGHNTKKLYNSQLFIIDRPFQINDNIWAIPHYYKSDSFLTAVANIDKPSTVFCHQELNGCIYDNGFYAPNAPDVTNTPHRYISGHIHKQQEFNNTLYTGAPRAFTASDANQSKFIWYFEILSNKIITREAFDTGDYVTRFFQIQDLPGIDNPLKGINLNSKAKIIIDIHGNENFIQKRLNFYNDLRKLSEAKFQIRTYLEKKDKLEIKESDGINLAFKKYFDKFVPRFGSDKEKLLNIVGERAPWLK